MKFDPAQHHRRSIRLAGYDYCQRGMYFVTICTHEEKPLFGRVADGKAVLNDLGETVRREWNALPKRFPFLRVGDFIIMPNHLHGVLAFVEKGKVTIRGPQDVGAASSAPTNNMSALGRVLRAFKSISAISVNRMRGTPGQPLWQRNYYEHIIRGAKDLEKIRRYIVENPMRWESHRGNP